jgi:hypothetical protein
LMSRKLISGLDSIGVRSLMIDSQHETGFPAATSEIDARWTGHFRFFPSVDLLPRWSHNEYRAISNRSRSQS